MSGSSGINENTMQESLTPSRFQFDLLRNLSPNLGLGCYIPEEMELDTPNREPFKLAWLDLLWMIFLGALAVLPPFFELHKELTLLAIGAFQIFEYRLLKSINPTRGRA